MGQPGPPLRQPHPPVSARFGSLDLVLDDLTAAKSQPESGGRCGAMEVRLGRASGHQVARHPAHNPDPHTTYDNKGEGIPTARKVHHLLHPTSGFHPLSDRSHFIRVAEDPDEDSANKSTE